MELDFPFPLKIVFYTDGVVEQLFQGLFSDFQLSQYYSRLRLHRIWGGFCAGHGVVDVQGMGWWLQRIWGGGCAGYVAAG